MSHSQAPARKIGKYEVTSVLGRGAMGVVYRAVDPALGRHVAIKTMSFSDKMPNDSEFRLRFLREARAVGRLQHPNIVTVHELFEEKGTAYMVMELLEGASLSSLLRKKKDFDLAEKLSILEQIASGLEMAHEHGIVHRDLKPSNVFVLRSGVVKVLDFGVAKVGEGDLTRAGTVFGTVEYMAPEQVRGESVSAQADVFSLGVVAYELFTGRNPFRAETLGASVFKILSDNPEGLAVHTPDVPPEVERVVFRALAKKRRERFRSMSELVGGLRAAARKLEVVPRLPRLTDSEMDTAAGGDLGSAYSVPQLDEWSNVAAAAGELEEVYRGGIEAFNSRDFESCVLAMSELLDRVPAHSMALHYLAQSEERIRQKKLPPDRHRQAVEVLAGMRRAHREGDSPRVVDLCNKALVIDPESLEARWYRRAAEARQRPSARTQIPRTRLRSLSFPSPGAETPGVKPTLVVAPSLPASNESPGYGLWVLGGVGLFFLALVGLIWGFSGGKHSAAARETPSRSSHVRVSPFDVDPSNDLVIQVSQETPPPAVSHALPETLPPGEPTQVGIFGKNFAQGLRLEPAEPGTLEVVSIDTIRPDLIEATLRPDAAHSGTTVILVIVNPDGKRSQGVQLTISTLP